MYRCQALPFPSLASCSLNLPGTALVLSAVSEQTVGRCGLLLTNEVGAEMRLLAS